MAKKLKGFIVTFTLEKVMVDVEVGAASIEEALAQGHEMKFTDLLTTAGDLIDYEGPRVTGVYQRT